MRTFVLITFFAGTAAGCNPYDPNLPSMPFRCGDTDPVCPSGYACAGTVCVEDDGGPDGGGPDSDNCEDLAEPNEMRTEATGGPVFAQDDYVQYEGLTLCPEMDTDFFVINQILPPPGPDIHALVEFEAISTPPALVIQNSSGAMVATGGATPTAGEIKAVLLNPEQGLYYVRVTSQAVLSHYRLTICGVTSTDPPCP